MNVDAPRSAAPCWTPRCSRVVGIAILIGLGIWQLDRKAWKEDLIATTDGALSAPPTDLPPREQWARLDPATDEFRRVTFPGRISHRRGSAGLFRGSALRPDVTGPGYWVFAPARLAGGSIVVVNRGFVPEDRKDPASRAARRAHRRIDITGVMRWPEVRGLFTPADEPAKKSLVRARPSPDGGGERMGCRRAVLYRPGSAAAAGRPAAARDG